jgi:hypothetical protein
LKSSQKKNILQKSIIQKEDHSAQFVNELSTDIPSLVSPPLVVKTDSYDESYSVEKNFLLADQPEQKYKENNSQITCDQRFEIVRPTAETFSWAAIVSHTASTTKIDTSIISCSQDCLMSASPAIDNACTGTEPKVTANTCDHGVLDRAKTTSSSENVSCGQRFSIFNFGFESSSTIKDDDGVGWIGPKTDSTSRMEVKDSLMQFVDKDVKVACVTTDFAMQNVLLQVL